LIALSAQLALDIVLEMCSDCCSLESNVTPSTLITFFADNPTHAEVDWQMLNIFLEEEAKVRFRVVHNQAWLLSSGIEVLVLGTNMSSASESRNSMSNIVETNMA
jgi:hypothetical protein